MNENTFVVVLLICNLYQKQWYDPLCSDKLMPAIHGPFLPPLSPSGCQKH